jgi:hypothetical protein
MANSPAWTRKEGKNPSGGLNAKGRARRRQQARLFLCKDEWNEKEAYQRQDSQRSKQPHQQKPESVELLKWT